MRVASSTFELQGCSDVPCEQSHYTLIPVVLRISILDHSEDLKETNILTL